MKGTTSMIAALSVIVSLLIISSTIFSGMARGQPYDAGYSGSYDDGNYGIQTPYAGGLAIPGMEGLQGFEPGENIMSLTVIPVSQQNNQLYFELIGFAITSPVSGQSVVYSFETPLAGVIDPAASTMQIDLSNIATTISQAGYIDSSHIYDIMRTDSRAVIINVDMSYQDFEASQTIFTVNRVDIVPPDGQVQSFALQEPTQLIIDSQSMRIYMVAFPQMITAVNSYYDVSYPEVLPIVYTQPVPILSPVFVPFIQPVPIFLSSFIPFNPFFFGDGFRPFFHHRFHGGFPIHDRFFWRRGLNDFDRFRGVRNEFGRTGFGHNEFGDRFRTGGGRDEFFRDGPGTRRGQDGNVLRQGEGRSQFGPGGRGFEDIRQGGIGEFRRGGQAGFAGPGTGDGGRISTPSVRNPAARFQPGNLEGGNRPTGGDGGRGIGSGGGITRLPAGVGVGSGRFSSGGGVQISAPTFSGDNKIRTPSVPGGNRISAPSGGRISGGGIRAPAGPARRSGGGEYIRRR
ncbi:MAG TPA: hypothetical protein VGJ92_11520 [Methanocella sp.]